MSPSEESEVGDVVVVEGLPEDGRCGLVIEHTIPRCKCTKSIIDATIVAMRCIRTGEGESVIDFFWNELSPRQLHLCR